MRWMNGCSSSFLWYQIAPRKKIQSLPAAADAVKVYYTKHYQTLLRMTINTLMNSLVPYFCKAQNNLQSTNLIFTIGYWQMALIFSVLNLWKPKLSWTCTYPWVIIWYQESWPQPQHGLTGGHFHEKSGLRKMGLDPRPITIWRPFNVHLKPWY